MPIFSVPNIGSMGWSLSLKTSLIFLCYIYTHNFHFRSIHLFFFFFKKIVFCSMVTIFMVNFLFIIALKFFMILFTSWGPWFLSFCNEFEKNCDCDNLSHDACCNDMKFAMLYNLFNNLVRFTSMHTFFSSGSLSMSPSSSY